MQPGGDLHVPAGRARSGGGVEARGFRAGVDRRARRGVGGDVAAGGSVILSESAHSTLHPPEPGSPNRDRATLNPTQGWAEGQNQRLVARYTESIRDRRLAGVQDQLPALFGD